MGLIMIQPTPARAPVHAMSAGFTLVELLIATTISVITMAMVAVLSVHQIRITDTISTTATLDRRFRTLSNLLREEFREACLLRADANPRTTATAPDTPCNPEPVSPCGNLTTGVSTPASGNDVRLLMPISLAATNTISYQVVRFYRSGTDLLRDGPAITNNGTLNSTTTTNGLLVASNVSAFTTTVSPDCSWATLNITMSVPGTATTQTRILTLYSGADLSIT
jgi:Tfp pilus assembly protein PilW